MIADTTYAINKLGVRQTDAAGNVSTIVKNAAQWVEDSTNPSAPTTLNLAAADDTGLNTDNITSNTTGLSIDGVAVTGESIQLYDGATAIGSPVTASSNAFTIDVSLAEGSHTITAKATDPAGNTGVASSPLTVVVDTSAPTNASSVLSASASKQGGVAVSVVSAAEMGGAIWLAPAGTTTTFTAGSTMTTAGGTDTSITTPADEGSYKLFVIDAAGNISTASTATVTVDNTAPTTTFTSAAYNSGTNTLTLTGTDVSTLLGVGESATTDVKSRLDWSKLVWYIDGDSSSNFIFSASDISSAKATDATHLTIILASATATSLEGNVNFDQAGTATIDTLDISAGFIVDLVGLPSTTDALTSGNTITVS